MIWTKDTPFVFLHVPKTGGSSIEQALCRRYLGKWPDEITAGEADEFLLPRRGAWRHHLKYSDLERDGRVGGGQGGVFVFGFVRNPWDLVISEIAYLKKHGRIQFSSEDWTENIRVLAEFSGRIWGHDFEPQLGYFTCGDGRIAADYIGRFENLQEHFETVCVRLGEEPMVLPHVLGSSGREHYSAYYTDETRALVEERFWPDIEMFGYEFEEPGRRVCFPPLDRVGLVSRQGQVSGAEVEGAEVPVREGGDGGAGDDLAGKMAIFFCIEGNQLEEQALLLSHSLREFGGLGADTRIFAVQPRQGLDVSPGTRDELEELGVELVDKVLNTSWRRYAVANKVFAGAHMEERLEGVFESIMFLDTDVLCCNYIGGLALESGEDAAVKPVDKCNVGLGFGRAPNHYWASVYAAAQVDQPPGWSVAPSLGSQRIYPYFNAGVIVVRPGKRIFRRSAAALDSPRMRLLFGSVAGLYRRHLEQCVLSAVITAQVPEHGVRILDLKYNYPFNLHERLAPDDRIRNLDDAPILHYHKRLYDPSWIEELEIPDRHRDWLLRLSGA